jgi:hypothetical protein
MPVKNPYAVARAAFGAYLFVHFAMLIPWAHEVFVEVLPRESSPFLRVFPNVLLFADVATPMIVLATIASLFFAFGRFDRIAAVILWYVLACLFGRNPLILNPSMPFAGWLLLAHAVAPGRVFAPTWIVMSLGYSYSGYTKLISPWWVDGTALARVLENPLARPSFVRDLVLALPSPLLQATTWGALALELLFAPLAHLGRVRPWLWLAMLLMHLGLMVLIDFTDLSFMMVIVHLFTFDPAGWPRRRDAPSAAAALRTIDAA